MNRKRPKLFVTIPVMDEVGYIEACIESISMQTYYNYHVIVCVNQPGDWWKDPGKIGVCENNKKSLEYLRSINYLSIEVIDRSSPGQGFLSNEKGVGHARNLLFARALELAGGDDLVMCLDADTTFDPWYFQSVVEILASNPDAVAHANPYYHKLTGEDNINRAILRYEIYMRSYVLNLWRIHSPYAFTALGSVITMRCKSMRSIGKVAPKAAGEDFYLLQKLRKYGRITQYNDCFVYPSSRVSSRVCFGTGPAVADGLKGKWERYPVYPVEAFNKIEETYNLFPHLFFEDIATPMDGFFEKYLGSKDLFTKIRNNYKTKDQFIRACHIKIDGLRLFQFVKYYSSFSDSSDEVNFSNLMNIFFENEEICCLKNHSSFPGFKNKSISLLQKTRDLLQNKELYFRKKDLYEPCISL